MKTLINPSLDITILNRDDFTRQLSEMDDEQLQQQLEIFHDQMEMAYEQRNLETYELLQEYEQQIISSRLK